MSLSQPKVDLAVLYRLHQHAEAGGEAIPPDDIMRLFNVHMPIRRVQLALSELCAKGDIEEEYHPFYSEVGLWQISRDGMSRVDRALKVPTSFIGRLHQHGDSWLESDEAAQAVLKKLSASEPKAEVPTVVLDGAVSLPAERQIDWGKWGAIAGLVAIPLAIILWYFS